MPTYDYFCECGEEKEVFRSMSDTSDIVCEICGKKMKQGFTGMSFILKGNGWASKGTATAGKAKHFKEVAVGVPEAMSGIVSKEVKKKAVAVRRGK